MKLISEFVDGDKLREQLLVGSVLKGVTNNGLTYLTIEFRDSSGTINGKKWEVTSLDEETFKVGNVVDALFEVINYKSSLQLKVLSGQVVNPESIDVVRFVKPAPESKEELIKKFDNYVNSLKDNDLKKIINYIKEKLGEKLFYYPAAVSLHHEYSSGLLYHTISMASLADYLVSYYKDIDRDILIAGILLHDLGKVIEFEGEVVYKYSLEGKLLGHISIGASLIHEASEKLNIKGEKITLLEHMVLSHHGQLEFGSPILPLTKEALILSMVDNMDSKIAMVNRIMETVPEGDFAPKTFALDNRSLYKPHK